VTYKEGGEFKSDPLKTPGANFYANDKFNLVDEVDVTAESGVT